MSQDILISIVIVIVLVLLLYCIYMMVYGVHLDTYGFSVFKSNKLKPKIRAQIKEILTEGWEVAEIGHIHKDEFDKYKVYVKIINKKESEWSNDYVKLGTEFNVFSYDFPSTEFNN